jgi:HTH-type transcriptional regulator/antitoxin HipB
LGGAGVTSGAARTLLLIAERNPKRGAQCRGLQQEQGSMSDLERYVKKRKHLKAFLLPTAHCLLPTALSQAREKAGMTQDDVARRLRTKKSAISRIENHAEDIRLSTIQKYAKALGKNLRVEIRG